MKHLSDLQLADSRATDLDHEQSGPLYGVTEALLVILSVLVLEIYIVACYANASWNMWQALAAHSLVLAGIGGCCYGLSQRDGGLHMVALLGVSVSVLGPMGAGGTLLTMVLHWWFSRSSTSFQEWYMSLFPDEEGDEARELYDLIATGREGVTENSTVRSFTEVLTHGSVSQKQAVVALLARNFRPMFAPALKLALKDDDASLRVQAATAAANIENEFLETSLDLKKQLDAAPDDFDTVLAMARHFDDYAFSGILDADQESDNRTQAVELYFRCLEIKPDDPQVTTAVGRFLLREDRTEEASVWVADAIDHGIDHLTMLNWHLECLYKSGDFDRIRNFAREHYNELGRSERQPQVLKDVVDVWAGYRPGERVPNKREIKTIEVNGLRIMSPAVEATP